jgi:hypothetical protein
MDDDSIGRFRRTVSLSGCESICCALHPVEESIWFSYEVSVGILCSLSTIVWVAASTKDGRDTIYGRAGIGSGPTPTSWCAAV